MSDSVVDALQQPTGGATLYAVRIRRVLLSSSCNCFDLLCTVVYNESTTIHKKSAKNRTSRVWALSASQIYTGSVGERNFKISRLPARTWQIDIMWNVPDIYQNVSTLCIKKTSPLLLLQKLGWILSNFNNFWYWHTRGNLKQKYACLPTIPV